MTTDTAVEPTTDAMDYPIEEIYDKYEGEWLAVIVTDEDMYGPKRGRAIYHSSDQAKVLKFLLANPDKRAGIHRAYNPPKDMEYLISIWETHGDTTTNA